jgi:CheY-like chemotaxis protein
MPDQLLITAPILVIDDDLDDQFLMQKIFERIGLNIELVFFNNGREAFTYLQETKRETFLILCDINMPVMNGLELRALINADHVLHRKCIPFVFLSTAIRESDIRQAYDMSVQGFFQKESSLDQMQEVIMNIVRYWHKSKHPNMLKRKQ